MLLIAGLAPSCFPASGISSVRGSTRVFRYPIYSSVVSNVGFLLVGMAGMLFNAFRRVPDEYSFCRSGVNAGHTSCCEHRGDRLAHYYHLARIMTG